MHAGWLCIVALTFEGMHADDASLDDGPHVRDARGCQGRCSRLEAPQDVAHLQVMDSIILPD